MECKNCQTNLKETAKFCDECGGKVINHRLNFKTVTEEFLETFISWDNKFLKTFTHLVTKPQMVANGYLDGIRKRYMQPFAYILVIFSIYSIYLYLSKDMMINYAETMNKSLPQILPSNKYHSFNFVKIMQFINDHDTAFTFATMPIFAFINKLIFKQRNFIEHNVLLLYVFGTAMFVMSIAGFVGMTFNINYSFINNLNQILLIVYSMYFYKKLFKLDIWDILLKTLYFWGLLILIYLMIIAIGGILVFILIKLNLVTP